MPHELTRWGARGESSPLRLRRRKAPDISSQRRRCRWRITSTGRRCDRERPMLYILAEHPWFVAASAAYATALALSAAAWKSTRQVVGRLATAVMCAALAMNLALIAGRWIQADRPPFKSLFESLVFLSFTTGAVYLVMERLYRTRIFGVLAAVGSFGALAYAVTKWDAEIVKLPPALQSGWFVPHVVVYFVCYGAAFFATAVAVVQLAAGRWQWVRNLVSVKAGTVLSGQPLGLEQIT